MVITIIKAIIILLMTPVLLIAAPIVSATWWAFANDKKQSYSHLLKDLLNEVLVSPWRNI